MNWSSNLLSTHTVPGVLFWWIIPKLFKNEAVVANIEFFKQNQTQKFNSNLGNIPGTLEEN